MTPLRITDLRKRYGHKEAVRGISFAVQEGAIFGLLGPNGSGKTTTFLCAVGLEEPDDGIIEVFGGPADSEEARRRTRFLPEIFLTYPSLTVRETLTEVAYLCGLRGARLQDAVDRWSELFGLGEHMQKPIRTLSKGLQRRVGLAATFLSEPDLLILDEPTWGLDPGGARNVKQAIQEVRNRGGAVLLSSHVLSEVERICTDIAILKDGRIIREGKMERLLRIEEEYEIVLEGSPDPQTLQRWEAMAHKLEQEGTRIVLLVPENCVQQILREITEKPDLQLLHAGTRKLTLEDYFLQVVGHES